MIDLILKTPNIIYNLNLEHKVNIILSEKGATGKSYIGEIINEIVANKGIEGYYMSHICTYLDSSLTRQNLEDIKENEILIIDETVKKATTNMPVSALDFYNDLYKCRGNVIYITRKPHRIYHSSHQVYDLYKEPTPDVYKIKQRYDMTLANRRMYKSILTEDSGPGCEYFQDMG